ncbi:oxygenase [Microtetraspora sp. NBRC 13810]|nr:oxygenase [Microtetraspora sp. NBRC 13810]
MLVVGAGPTGLALATELRRQGVACRIIDLARERPANQARAVALWPGALDVLARHGIAAEVIDAGLRMSAARYWSGGRNVATVRLAEMPNGMPTMLGITQPAVEEIQVKRLHDLGVDVEWQTRLDTLSDLGDRVEVRLTGPDGTTEELAASWVVGCDGAHSRVRELTGIPFGGQTYTQSFVLGDGDVDSPVPPGEAHYHLHPKGVLVLVTLPGDGLRVFADGTGVGSPDTAPTLEELQRLADERAPYKVTIRDLRWSTRFLVHMRQAARYRSGRCLLAGDAAHVHSPAGGQGLNTGIQDAANVGWKLALIHDGADADALLAAYEAERSPVAASVLRGAHQQTRLWTVRSPIGRVLRDTLLGTLDRAGVMERRIVPTLTQDDLDYRRSPAVGARGGRRALGPRGLADTDLVPVGEGPQVRLSALLADPRHVLVVLADADGANGADAVRVRNVLTAVAPLADRLRPLVLLSATEPDADGEWAGPDAYLLPPGYAPAGALNGSRLVLVRPDGYVADASATLDLTTLTGMPKPPRREPVPMAPDSPAQG